MTRRNEGEWRALFAEQAASGLNAAAFCRGRGVEPKYFSLRRRQLLGAPVVRTAKTALAGFVPVAVPRGSDVLVLEVGAGRSLRMPSSVSPGWLAELLGALRG